jgi:hypothetical protein
MDDISQILKGKNLSEPPEVAAIKKFILDKYEESVKITVHNDSITLTVASSSLANLLRLDSQEIIKACGLTKKLVLRIG